MALTLKDFDNLLETVYIEGINNTIPVYSEFWDWINKNGEATGGDKAVIRLRTGSNITGVGSAQEGEPLPIAGKQRYTKIEVQAQTIYATMSISGKVMRATANSYASAASALTQEQEGLIQDFTNELERQIIGNDETGRLATVSKDVTPTAGSGKTVIPVKQPGTLYFNFDARDEVAIDIYRNDTPVATNVTVIEIDDENQTVTIDKEVAVKTGDTIHKANGRNAEMLGLLGGIANGSTFGKTLYGINRATEPKLQSYEVSVGTAFSLSDIRSLLLYMRTKRKANIDTIWTTWQALNLYMDMLTEHVRYVNVTRIDGAIEAPAFDNIPIRTSNFIYADPTEGHRMYFLDKNTLQFHPMAPGKNKIRWLKEDGQILRMIPANETHKDMYVAYLILEGQMGYVNPYVNAVLTGIK